MEDLGRTIDQVVARDGIDEPTIDGWERLRAVLGFVGKRLAGADTRLIDLDALGGIATELEAALAAARSAVTDPDPSILASAHAHADQILRLTPALNTSGPVPTPTPARGSAS